MASPKAKYQVIRDKQEKAGYWDFPASDSCAGTVVEHLKTADYTLRGYEHAFAIERKASTGEFAQNVNEKRFVRELERLEAFAHPFMVLEFTMADLLAFPHNSGIPQSRWPHLRVKPQYLLRCVLAYQCAFKTKIILAGAHGREVASSLFKRIVEVCPAPPPAGDSSAPSAA